MGVLGIDPLNGEQSDCHPQDAPPCMEAHRMMYHLISSTGVSWT